jgi:acetyl-CoA carboxylase biotin carboxyl carrier protein
MPAVVGEEPRVAEEVRAEMVANVWKVVASQGDRIEVGDTVVILESMKMEIPVPAEVAGTVTAIHVTEGDVVQEGDVLAVIE